ncbi:hypothetical protein [Corallococcus sp. CA053C]|uniref:hypothetical protein n=1 Tax=Corallococcus sp. CA053C TaxID=2316732 RepID=UPI0011C43854|nr:hypothetical protein [Corallococcus sp. CA053C]
MRVLSTQVALAVLGLPLGALAAPEPEAKPAVAQDVAPAPPTPPPLVFRLQARLDSRVLVGRQARLDDYSLDSILVVPGVGGQLTPWFSYGFSAVAYAQSFETAQPRILDTVGMFKLAESFQIWAGRFVVPFDRFNLSGPFRNLIWSYPGIYDGVRRIGGENGPFGRDTGLSVWGSVGQGFFKYHLMAHQLELGQAAPRLTGRVSFSFLDREPGYFVSTSYLGEKDVVSVGVAMQYQHDGRVSTVVAPAGAASVLPLAVEAAQAQPLPTRVDNLWAVTADLFAEKRLGTGLGTATFDVGYYEYDEHRSYRRAYAITGAYLPHLQMGPGRTQVGLRWEQAYASPLQPQLSNLKAVDLSVSYHLSGYNLRLGLDAARQWLGARTANNIAMGLQYSPP